MKAIGMILVITGLILTIFTAVTFFTKEKVVDLGKIEITQNKQHNLDWSPLIGIAVMGVGGAFLWQSYRKKD